MEKEQTVEEKLNQAQKQYEKVVQQNRDLQAELQPFRVKWFNGLDTRIIAGLAFKSIKMTTDWINAETLIDTIESTVKNASPQNAIRIIKEQIVEYRKFNGGNVDE